MVFNRKEASGSSSYGVPFFTRPFGTMFGCTGGLFGPAGFAGMRSLLLLRLHVSPLPASDRGVLVEELLDDKGTPESKASNYQQHIVEHPDDAVGSTHRSNNQLMHENSCQLSSDGNYHFHPKCRTCQDRSESFYCSLSASKPGLHEVHATVRKRGTTCTDPMFTTGYLEPPRKQFKS